MASRKIILYPHSAMKPIIITDDTNTTDEELTEKIKEMFASDKIHVLETGHDNLIVRPSEIQAVLITKTGHSKSGDDTADGKYQRDLKIDNK